MSGSEVDDLDNPKHKYYLKVCYICKETTVKEHCIHYGALACFSCRAFFRRSHQSMQDKGFTPDGKRKLPEFVCKKSGKCNVTPKTRRRCQKCRYDLCIKAGMQPEAVMTEDQVKVRFRKMFTKRGENKNSVVEENKDAQSSDTETYPAQTFVAPEARRSLDTPTSQQQQQQHDHINRIHESGEVKSFPSNHMSQFKQNSTEYLYNRGHEEERNPFCSSVNHVVIPETSRHEANLEDEDGIFSNVFNQRLKEGKAKEPSISSEKESEHAITGQNITKKQIILGRIGAEYESSLEVNPPEFPNSWNCEQTEIKQENLEPLQNNEEFFSYSDEERMSSHSYDANEPQIELVEYGEIKQETESPESFCGINDLTSNHADVGYHNIPIFNNDGEMLNTNDNFEANYVDETVHENSGTKEQISQPISDDEDKAYLKSVGDLSPSRPYPNTTVDPFDDVEKSIDFNKIISPNINGFEQKQQSPSPPIFKSPTLLNAMTVKTLRKKPKNTINSKRKKDFRIKLENKSQDSDATDSNINKYNRMCIRISDLETSYKIACSQVSFSDDLVNELVNFHLGCSSAKKEHYLTCANAIVSH